MIVDIFLNYIFQVAFTIGSIVLFGAITAFCNHLFYRNLGSIGQKICYVTGIIGTPIHETSHALVCLLFGHKIVDIKFFQIHAEDGTLGYVNHTYNSRNLYQRIGNFFIGIAPILIISLLLYILSLWLTPDMINLLKEEVINFTGFNSIANIFKTLADYAKTGLFWIFIIISLFLALHMNLSKADIQGALSGLIFLLATIFVVDLCIGIVSIATLNNFSNLVMTMATSLNMFLILSTCISIILVLLSYLYKLIRR